MMTKWLLKKGFGKNYCKDPAQYIRLISFTPPANKPAELHRINILVIEIGFPKKSGQAVPHQTQFQLLQIIKTLQSRFYKNQFFKNSFIPIWRKFLDKLCQKQGLRLHCISAGHGFCKNNLHPSLASFGENICGVVFFLQRPCFCWNLFQGWVATIWTNEAYADFKHLLNN